jgi:hypothetical protein
MAQISSKLLPKDSFADQPLAQTCQNLLIVERLGKPLLALLDRQSIALILASELVLFELIERIHRIAQDIVLALIRALVQARLESLADIGRNVVCHEQSLPRRTS